jgi:hypothetical protein
MTLPPYSRSSALYLSWIGGLCGAVVVLLGNVFPYPLPFATPGAFFLSLVEVELFFALLAWPLFVPSLEKDGIRGLALLGSVAILILFALPLLLIGANVSGIEAAEVLRSQAQVAAFSALGAGIASRWKPAMPVYLGAVFLLSTLPPLSYYLESQMQARAPLGTPYWSPFWGAAAAGPAAWVQAGVAGVAGLALLARKGPA